MPRIDSKRLPLRLKRSCTDVINQLTKPQQAPTSSIPGIQVCKSRAGAVRLLCAASRKYNFDLHVLESKAQDAEDGLDTVASQAQKVMH
ncbi:unnamed protein product [Prunus armeniaca]